MKGIRDYKIDIFNLSLKQHEFEFPIDDRLFTLNENSLVQKGSGICKLLLEKASTMMTLHFHIEASVELICDRSLELFDYPMTIDEGIIIKFGEDDYTLSEEVYVIRHETPSIDVSEFIYEFISVAVPMKKLHPRYQGEQDEQPEMVYSTQSELDDSTGKENETDPRWAVLKKLKDNK